MLANLYFPKLKESYPDVSHLLYVTVRFCGEVDREDVGVPQLSIYCTIVYVICISVVIFDM